MMCQPGPRLFILRSLLTCTTARLLSPAIAVHRESHPCLFRERHPARKRDYLRIQRADLQKLQ